MRTLMTEQEATGQPRDAGQHTVETGNDAVPERRLSDAPWPESTTVATVVHYSRRLSEDPSPVEVQATIPPLLADLAIAIPSTIATESAEAERDLATLDAYASGLPLSVVEAVTTSLLRAESLSSSRIEGLDISHRRLSEAFYDPAAAKRLAREVANNTIALQHAIRLGSGRKPITPHDIVDIHAALMDGVPGIKGGEIRGSQNWIGPTDDPLDADFVPPPVDRIDPLLEDLCEFIERDDLPPTIRAAIGHAQFEAIHPFIDGNGRVGRCLISVILRRGNGTDVVPQISGVCASDTAAYFASLQRFQQAADPWPWVSQFCRATSIASATANRLSDDIVDLQARWMEQAGNPRAGSIANRLIAVLPTMSFTDADVVAEHLNVDANVARRGLNHLEDAGILSTIAGRKRNRVWRADEFHALLDRYSAGFTRTAE